MPVVICSVMQCSVMTNVSVGLQSHVNVSDRLLSHDKSSIYTVS